MTIVSFILAFATANPVQRSKLVDRVSIVQAANQSYPNRHHRPLPRSCRSAMESPLSAFPARIAEICRFQLLRRPRSPRSCRSAMASPLSASPARIAEICRLPRPRSPRSCGSAMASPLSTSPARIAESGRLSLRRASLVRRLGSQDRGSQRPDLPSSAATI